MSCEEPFMQLVRNALFSFYSIFIYYSYAVSIDDSVVVDVVVILGSKYNLSSSLIPLQGLKVPFA